ncbi:hypothetical protein MIDIC_110099 [Alphaproteobacteria bacterium]
MLLIAMHYWRGHGIQFVDSTPLETCKAHVALDMRFFVKLLQKVEQAPVWFYGLKLHTIFNDKSEFVSIRITLNDKSEFVSIRITPGNVDDRKPVLTMAKGLWGKLFGR